jgi:hypothetical protein
MTKVRIINNAGNIFADRFLRNYFGGDEAVYYLTPLKAHWLKDHEGQVGNLLNEHMCLKISIDNNYELFEKRDSYLFEVIK